MNTVAVEQGLLPIKAYLEAQGCRCIEVETETALVNDAAVLIVTGADRNIMGMQDVTTDIPIVSADGLTPEEVYQRVRTYLH